MREVFWLAAIPGALVVIIVIAAVREAPAPELEGRAPPDVRAGLGSLGRPFRRLLLAVLIFTLGNSTDAFLLLRLADAGVAPAWIALLWSAHHVIKMGATYLGGRHSDVRGRRSMMVAGWLLYAAVYVGFALVEEPAALIAIFVGYGIYFGLTEPVERAWVSDLAPAELRGTAFGWYHGAVGIAALPASLLFGLLWAISGPALAFGIGAGLALIAVALVLRVSEGRNPPHG
jgi:MFS family permease